MVSAFKKAFGRFTLYMALGALALIAGIWGVTLERLDYEHKDAIADAVRKNDDLALAFEEHTIRTMRAIDSALYMLRRAYLRDGSKFDIRESFESEAFDRTLVLNAAIVSESGRIVTSIAQPKAAANMADREYFAFHRQSADNGMMIGKPLMSRITDKWSLLMTRRIDRPDGSFGGAVVIGVDPEYFARFYDGLNLSTDGQVMLIGLDGIVRARRTGTKVSAGDDFRGRTLFKELARNPVGHFVSRGELDGVRRHLSYRTVKDFPLAVVVGSSEADLMPGNRARSRFYLSAAALLSLTTLLLGATIALAIRRRQVAADEVIRNAARYSATFDQATLGMAHFSADGRYMKVNARLCSMLGYTEAELRLLTFRDALHPGDVSSNEAYRRVLDRAAPSQSAQLECRQVRKDDSVLWTAVSLMAVHEISEELQYVLGIVEDITERKQAEETRLATLRRVRAQQDAAGAASASGALIAGEVEQLAREITELAAKTAGVERANVWLFNDDETELHCIDCYEATPARHSAGAVLAESQFANEFAALKQANYVDADDPLTDPRTAGYVEGYLKPFGISSMLDAVVHLSGKHLGLLCLEHVGTPHRWERDEIAFACQLADRIALSVVNRMRREVQETLRENERRLAGLAAIVEHSNDAIVGRSLDGTITSWNAAAAKLYGYTAAEAIGQPVSLIIPSSLKPRTKQNNERLVREGHIPPFETQRLTRDGRILDVSNSLSLIRDADGQLIGAAQITRDITEQKKADAMLRQSTLHLAENLKRTAEAIATTIEMRDPFTAGHQRHVAELAVAIGTALDLPPQQIEGIGFGASIHDVGLVAVPAEILNRPGRLKPLEFKLVKTHSQAGYEIVRNIEFCWPVAQMILQHHERLDGSGYPAGLKGEVIILEARILAVADVVEAMSSHRPYRPACGVEAALGEIARNKGRLYDPAVVDACLRVFREQGFVFSGAQASLQPRLGDIPGRGRDDGQGTGTALAV